MYKEGDKIILIEDFEGDPRGTVYKITKGKNGHLVWKGHWVVNNWYGKCPFKLYKEIKNETDWLDNIQQNFKEGI